MENFPQLNDKGQEVLDPVPMAIPVGFQRPLTLQEQVRRLMRSEYDLIRAAGVNDVETPEEADDFDVGDDVDIDPVSGHEYTDPELDPSTVPTESLREEIQKEDKVTSGENPPGENPEATSA